MNGLQIFNHPEFGKIRTWKESDGSVSFCAPDAAAALGYKDSQKAIKQHCKKDGWAFHPVIDSLGRQQKTKFISQGNLLRLAANSKLPGADKFENWIFDDVIPTVLKHGAYMTSEKIEEVLLDPDTIISLAQQLKKERTEKQQLAVENEKQKRLIGAFKPKVSYCDIILNNKCLISITQIAKDYGMSGRQMNLLLHKIGVQYEQSGQWLLYAKHHDKGYTHSQTIPITHKDGTPGVRMQTKWTQKGRFFLYQILKDNGILPIIEQEDRQLA